MKFNPVTYADKYKKVHHSYEVYAYPKFKTALDTQIKPVIAHVKAYGGISAELADMLIRKQPLESAYKEVYVNVGSLHASWTLKQINALGKKSIPQLFSEKWRKLMELFFTNESSTRISDVTETTREKVRKVLADSTDMSISERVTYITDTLDSPDFNRNRALVIARTESTTASNKGASIGNEDADYETNKTWISVLDANTRPDHVDADGQTVGNDESFVVGGYQCMYPGDMSLPANEVIQCRCTLAFIPIIRNGLPILK